MVVGHDQVVAASLAGGVGAARVIGGRLGEVARCRPGSRTPRRWNVVEEHVRRGPSTRSAQRPAG